MKFSLRLLYLYLFSFIGLIITVIGTVQLVNLGLRVYLFKEVDKYVTYPYPAEEMMNKKDKEVIEPSNFQEKELLRTRQRQASGALSMLIIGLPLYLYHWRLIKKEK